PEQIVDVHPGNGPLREDVGRNRSGPYDRAGECGENRRGEAPAGSSPSAGAAGGWRADAVRAPSRSCDSSSYTYVSHPCVSGSTPLTMSKKVLRMASVIGRAPVPIAMRSMLRIGVTSTAVPQKNASSAR